jgi:hypothetical protein
MNKNKITKNNKFLINSIDIIILVLVISSLMYDTMSIFISLIESLFKLGLNNDFVLYMVENYNSNNHSTNVQVIHVDGSWASGIRSLFIYATGALRLSLLRGGGTPSSRAFIIGSTIGADAVSKIINNTINDPKYILSQFNNWRTLWDGQSETAEVYVEGDKETTSAVKDICQSIKDGSNNFIPDGKALDEISNSIVSKFMGVFKSILEPVKVTYSNELLANQLNDLSILLFILSIFIIILLVGFMLNILVYLYSDKISNYFTNKYIKWYVNFNKKIIGIELLFLGSSILYFMYILSYGIHFLATHPIIFN